jgi:hypothetical protein
MQKWESDSKVIEYLNDLVKKHPFAKNVFVAGRDALTWQEVLKDVEQGTGFGRSYHEAVRRDLEARSSYFR